jgi:hypothetical protein
MGTEMVKTNLEKQNDYTARRKAKGLVRIPLWVPEHQKEDLRLMAKAMCDKFEHTKATKSDKLKS